MMPKNSRTPFLNNIAYGCDYNPEQWPESVWEEDIRLMTEARVNLVNLGIFSWALINPAPGKYDFGWLDRIMDRLAAAGISVNLATATASPPAWLVRAHPDIRPVTRDGVPLDHGSRQAYSPNSEVYKEHASALVRALAEHYKDHPALAYWHINNEYMCHVSVSHTAEDDAAFRKWLQARYGSLEGLNAAWTSAFWSQRYYDWGEITTPKATPYHHNPSAALDFRRFMNDSFRSLFEMERAILKEITPNVPVTTNFIAGQHELNAFSWAPSLDIAAIDSYPDPNPEAGSLAVNNPFDMDVMRSLKDGRPFMLMEQSTDAVNWRSINHIKRGETMRLWTLQAVSRGADGIQFFQWRQSLGGAERFHSAMVPPVHPRPNAIFERVCRLGRDLEKLAPVAGATTKAECAIIYDWETAWALEQPGFPRKVEYREILNEYHGAFVALNLPVDVIPPDADFSKYRAIFAPGLFLLDEAEARALSQFVKQGGLLVTGFFSGVADRCNHLVPGGYPAYLADALGIWVENWEPEKTVEGTPIRMNDGRVVKAGYFNEHIHLTTAQALGWFQSGAFEGAPALTVNRYGKGVAYYVGARPKASFYRYALSDVVAQLKLYRPLRDAPVGVEATERIGKDGTVYLFLMNHNCEAATVGLDGRRGADLLSDDDIDGEVAIEARGVRVIAIATGS